MKSCDVKAAKPVGALVPPVFEVLDEAGEIVLMGESFQILISDLGLDLTVADLIPKSEIPIPKLLRP
jgi:hypothetical protein